jgi:hypothetical protein
MRAHWTFPFERLYGALMLATRHCNRSSVTQTIVNTIPLLYINDSDSGPERQFKTTSNFHPFLLRDELALNSFLAEGFSFKGYVIDEHDQTWRPGNLVCILPANASVDEHSIFVVVAVLQRVLSLCSELEDLQRMPSIAVVLREVPLKWMRIGPRLNEKLLALPENYAEHLGRQRGFLLNDPSSVDVAHVCGVVHYQYQDRPEFVIPFCGMVNFKIE